MGEGDKPSGTVSSVRQIVIGIINFYGFFRDHYGLKAKFL